MMWNQYKYTTLPLSLEPLPSNAAKSAKSEIWLMKFCHTAITCLCFLIMIITLPVSIWFSIKIVYDYERMVIFRLGRVQPPKGPGLVLVVPLIDQFQRVDMRSRAFSIQPSKVKSRDDVLVSLKADVHFRVCDPILSLMSVQDLNFVIQHTAENLLAQSLGRKYLKEIYGGRVQIAEHLKEDINEQVKVYGVCIDHTEVQLEAVLRPHEENVNVPVLSPALGPTGGLEQMVAQLVSLAQQTVAATDSSPSPVADFSLQQMTSQLEGILSESLVSEVGSSYQLIVTRNCGESVSYFIDLTSGSGSSGWGVFPGNPDVTLMMTEADLMCLIKGDLSPMTAYAAGRLQVIGDLRTALQLEKVLQRIAGR
ncbi:stomatin-like protein 1 isoform X1 [Rana temporaria]|uniref:stomatin-like protein 1 isoform X1 n=1 Tax=Rana temporaria TaxID=8407 RepID=UPI001AAC74A1|nr:stomatin-like protein 1 isoform X1 [Rana temporaria]XP_040198942.1 stomatin-like protein 1 isoform X1 [Rana temporaria]